MLHTGAKKQYSSLDSLHCLHTKAVCQFWPVKNQAVLADGPNLCVCLGRGQEEGVGFFVASTNPPSLSLCKWLALYLPLDNFISQKISNDLYNVSEVFLSICGLYVKAEESNTHIVCDLQMRLFLATRVWYSWSLTSTFLCISAALCSAHCTTSGHGIGPFSGSKRGSSRTESWRRRTAM